MIGSKSAVRDDDCLRAKSSDNPYTVRRKKGSNPRCAGVEIKRRCFSAAKRFYQY